MDTVSKAIDVLGGNGAVAAHCGVLPNAVSNWRKRGRLPKDKLQDLDGLARARGVTIPRTLFGFSAPSEAAPDPEEPTREAAA